MIEAGDGWKFSGHLSDRGFFADQVVEHLVSGHSAVRRVFSDKFSRDAAAVQAVRDQAAIAATVQHPCIPTIFFHEEVQGQLCLYFEYVKEPYLDQEIARFPLTAPSLWARRALSIAKAFALMERLGVATDRVRLDSIAIDNGLIRFTNRWPLSNLSELEIAQSPFLQRLAQSPYGGVYVSKDEYPTKKCLGQLKNILFFLASGRTDRTVRETLEAEAERAKASGKPLLAPLGVDASIEKILMRLHDPRQSGGIETLEALEAALAELAGGRRRGMVAAARPESEPVPAIPPGGEPSGEYPLPKPTPGEERRREVPAPNPEPKAARPAAAPAAPAAKKSSGSQDAIREDAQEDRAYLYPTRSSGSGSGNKPPSSGPTKAIPTTSSMMTAEASKPSAPASAGGGGAVRAVVTVVALLLVLGGLGAGIYFALSMSKPDTPPIAVIAPAPAQAVMYDRITLDGTGSKDPEGKPLTYTWSVSGLGRTDFLFSRNTSPEASTTELQIFQSGDFTVQLEVFDGKFLSEQPAQTHIAIVPRGG